MDIAAAKWMDAVAMVTGQAEHLKAIQLLGEVRGSKNRTCPSLTYAKRDLGSTPRHNCAPHSVGVSLYRAPNAPYGLSPS